MEVKNLKLYVEAKSKKEINTRLEAGEIVYGYNYSFFGGGGLYALNSDLEKGTVIATYTKKDFSGNPIARFYGTWTGSRCA